jgi:tripartite-type tricarboxylate transporter receptor subunit TctC
MKKYRLGRLLLAAAIACAGSAYAQDFPAKLIKIIVPYPAGGTTDALARHIAEKVHAKWGQVVIVENRGGAAGNIGAEAVWRAAPDGYTLLFASPGPLAINKSLYPKLAYEPETFTPVSLAASAPNVLITSPKLGIDSLPQLIAYAKANPERLNYASQGNGSTSHLTAEMFKSAAGVKMTHVPYKGSGPAIMDLLGGQVDIMFVELSSVLTHIRAGTVRVLAVGSEKRNPLLPNVPTVAEVLPGFASTTWFALAAPPKTPPAIVNKLSAAVAEALKQPDVATRLTDLSLDSIGSTPAELAQYMKQETERWRSVILTTGSTMAP